MLGADPWMAHSALSPAMNLGLLHPLEAVHAAEQAYRQGRAPLNSVEGYVRQVIGWREYVWSLYWHFPRGLPRPQRPGRRRRPAGVVPHARRRRAGDGELPVVGAARPARARLGAPHPAADGARQLRPAARLGPAAGDRVVPRGLRRRLRLGDAAERHRHEPARRRRPHDDQAVRLGRRLHRPDERLLRRLRVRPEGAGRADGVPVHRRATGRSSSATPSGCRTTAACASRSWAWAGSRTSTSWSCRSASGATRRPEPRRVTPSGCRHAATSLIQPCGSESSAVLEPDGVAVWRWWWVCSQNRTVSVRLVVPLLAQGSAWWGTSRRRVRSAAGALAVAAGLDPLGASFVRFEGAFGVAGLEAPCGRG